MSLRRIILLRAALLVGALAASFLLAEVLLRVAGIGYPQFFEPDPQTGSWHQPGVHGHWTAEGDADVSINSRGLRDVEHALEKPPGVYRIAVLGDSYAEALQVESSETFWSIAAEALVGCPLTGGRSIEPINFGVSGFGTIQELVTLRTRVWRYDPDLVLLLFIPNDVRNNHPVLEGSPVKPYARLVEGRIELDDSFRESAEYRYATSPAMVFRRVLMTHSRVFQLTDEMRRIWKRIAIRDEGRDSQDLVYAAPQDDDWRDAWALTEAALAQIAHEVREHGARFLLAVGTFGPQIHPDAGYRDDYVRRTPVTDFDHPERVLSALAEREGFDLVVLSDPMRAEAESSGICLHGFENAKPCGGHWNEAGHRAAGELIARHLCQPPG